jgi:hypothetical protein
LAGAGKLCIGSGARISLDLFIVHRTSVRQPVIGMTAVPAAPLKSSDQTRVRPGMDGAESVASLEF